MSLENAEPEVKLAVDLIMLLENNEIAPDIVLAALEIVRRDYLAKAEHCSISEKSKGTSENSRGIPRL